MIHYLFLGHFERDGEIVQFTKGPNEPAYRPVVCRPLDRGTVQAVLEEVKGTKIGYLAFPEDWMIWPDNGYLVCDKYTRNREAIDFVARLVERTHCEIHDVSAHRDITLGDWLEGERCYTEPSPAVAAPVAPGDRMKPRT